MYGGTARQCAVARPNSGSLSAAADKKVEFIYDYMGRRIEKKVSTHNGSSWSVTDTRRFVWSDWLLVLELDATDPNDVTVLRKYTSGLDLAGQCGGSASGRSIDDAGGIGGLLATYDANSSKSYLYFHDANGNVGQLIDRSDGSIAAKYEYDAYGNNLLDPSDPNESGSYADDNPFRFSTKYFDDETDLGYWGYRYYASAVGRWINRDPIGEQGGLNVYQYVGNSPTWQSDPRGQETWGDDPCRAFTGMTREQCLQRWYAEQNRRHHLGARDPAGWLYGRELEVGVGWGGSILLYTVPTAPPVFIFGTVSASLSASPCKMPDQRCCIQYTARGQGGISAQIGGTFKLHGGPLERKKQPGGGTTKCGKRTTVPGPGLFDRPVKNPKRPHYRKPVDSGLGGGVGREGMRTCEKSRTVSAGFSASAVAGAGAGVGASVRCDYTFIGGRGWACDADLDVKVGVWGASVNASGHLTVTLKWWVCQ